MSSSATWNGTSTFSRVTPRRGSRLGGFGQAGANGSPIFLAAGLLIGLIVGLPILGWWLWPIQVENAVPADLAPAFQQAYVAMAADSYALNGDADLARARLGSWDAKAVAAIVTDLETNAVGASSQLQAKRLSQLRQDLGLQAGVAAGEPRAVSTAESGKPRAATASARKLGTWPALLALVVFAGAALIVGGYVLYRQASFPSLASAVSALRSLKLPHVKLPALRRQRTSRVPVRAHGPRPVVAAEALVEDKQELDEDELSLDEAFSLLSEDLEIQPREPVPAVSGMPLSPVASDTSRVVGSFLATYHHATGDVFDTSYSIETEDGEFLGECGVGIAETIGDSSPQRACAMEVWLFDKSDIRTTTKLIVSEYAIQDTDIREALTGRGETVRGQGGQTLRLESAGLTLAVQVIDLKYSEAADAPPRSYFQEATLELTALQK